MRRSLFCVAVVVLLGSVPRPSLGARPEMRVRVQRLNDGDTFVGRHDGRQVNVRLWGVDAPESRQPYGARAERLLESLIDGKTVTVRPITRDDYGRTVAIVVLEDGRVLQEVMLEQGLVWVYRRYVPRSREAEWLPIEERARDDRRGLWADDDPVPPWRWRQTH